MRFANAAPDWELQALDVRTWRSRLASLADFLRCDVWYTIGTGKATVWFEVLAFLMSKPRVVHWVGSDITALGRFAPYRLLWRMRRRRTTHVAEVDWTARELAGYGLDAQTISLPLHLGVGPPASLPSVFTVLLYIPAGAEAFYGVEQYEHLIASCRDLPITFIVVGGGRVRADGNDRVKQLPWIETSEQLDEAYERSTVLIRMTPRDGLSCMVLEALSRGRHVVWSKPFQGAHYAATFDDARSYLMTLYERFRTNKLEPQTDAAAFIQANYDSENSVRALSAHWSSLLLSPAGRRQVAKDAL